MHTLLWTNKLKSVAPWSVDFKACSCGLLLELSVQITDGLDKFKNIMSKNYIVPNIVRTNVIFTEQTNKQTNKHKTCQVLRLSRIVITVLVIKLQLRASLKNHTIF